VTEVTPDPRPEKRIKATQADWLKLYAEKMGPCRVCGVRLQDWAMSLHHIVSKSLGGSDVADNLAPLCGSGVTGCHGLIEAHDPTAGVKLRANLTEAELLYASSLKGWDYLERRYGGPLDASAGTVGGSGARIERDGKRPAETGTEPAPSRSTTACPKCEGTGLVAAKPPVEERKKRERKPGSPVLAFARLSMAADDKAVWEENLEAAAILTDAKGLPFETYKVLNLALASLFKDADARDYFKGYEGRVA
jgi:hypothetical protein